MVQKKKVIAYVDGFNLYYSILRKEPKLKWLNLKKLCSSYLDPNGFDLMAVKYFTADIINLNNENDSQRRQQLYNRALQSSGVEIIKGKIKKRSDWKRRSDDQSVKVKVDFLEEKHTDVNIACHMIFDASIDAYDTAILITNDSDLKSPLEFVRGKQGKEVFMLWASSNPKARPNNELKKLSTRVERIKEGRLLADQFPKTVTDDQKRTLSRPKEWQ